jgi:anthranilate phosphoribosyltransferase
MGVDLNRLLSSQSLSESDAQALMFAQLDGELTSIQMAAVLTALRVRGETVAEITGFAKAMRERAVRVHVKPGVLVDTCGAGGSGVSVFNISTAAAFVVAASGLRVAKHGNRTATRKSGSADLFEAIGVKLEMTPEHLAQAIDTVGIAFLFARNHHPAMRVVAPVRAELGVPTVFNILGPLTNPAGATHQLLGVPRPALLRPMAEVLRDLGTTGAMLVHGVAPDGSRYDDISVAGTTSVAELKNGEILEYSLEPEDLGLERHAPALLLGGTAAENAVTVRAVLGGGGSRAQRDAVAANAAGAIYTAGRADNLKNAVVLALEILKSGAALTKLEAYVKFSQGS